MGAVVSLVQREEFALKLIDAAADAVACFSRGIPWKQNCLAVRALGYRRTGEQVKERKQAELWT